MVTKGQGTESSIKRYKENALIYLAYFQGRNEKVKKMHNPFKDCYIHAFNYIQ